MQKLILYFEPSYLLRFLIEIISLTELSWCQDDTTILEEKIFTEEMLSLLLLDFSVMMYVLSITSSLFSSIEKFTLKQN